MQEGLIYLDNAASTQVAPEVVEAMLPYLTEHYAVASSQFSHTPGIVARERRTAQGEATASWIGAEPEEFIFTSGATEANNLALKGTARANHSKGDHLIISKVEHLSVLHPCRNLEKEDFSITYLDVDYQGFVNLNQLEDSITEETILVSIQWATARWARSRTSGRSEESAKSTVFYSTPTPPWPRVGCR